MSDVHPNELAERRVIRLLSGLAAEVPPLPPEEVDVLLESATLGMGSRRRSRRDGALHLRRLIAAGAAAAVVIGVALGSTMSSSRPASPAPATANTKLADFPEGSALELLLSVHGSDNSS